MARTIDDIYTALVSLSDQIASLSPTDPKRTQLEKERAQWRIEAASLATAGRHPRSVELEIEAIEQRLDQIDALLITEGYAEKRGGKNLQDPSAYSGTINRLLAEQHADEVESLTKRLKELRHSPNDLSGENEQVDP
jgi:hypothetical protein